MQRFWSMVLAFVFLAALTVAAQGASSATSAASAVAAAPAITGSGVIRGVVVDEGGKPLAGELVIEAEVRDYERFIDRGLDIVTTETNASSKIFEQLRARRVISEQRTDGAGRFEFKGLVEGEYVVAVLDAVLPQQSSKAITVEAGKAAEVTLKKSQKPAGFLAGRLVKPDGTPLGAGKVPATFVCQFENTKFPRNTEIQIDEAGRFYINLRPTLAIELSRTIYLAVPGYQMVKFEMTLDPQKSYEQEVKLTPEKDDAELLGKVLMPDGQPAAGVSVEPYVAEEPWPGYRPQLAQLLSKYYYLGESQAVVTGSDGTFRVTGLRPGTYGLMAQTEHPGIGFKQGSPLRPGLAGCGPTFLENLPVAESQRVGGLELRLPKYGKLTITVTDAATGRPLAGARVGFFRTEEKGPLFRLYHGTILKTDAQGRAQAVGLYPCKYEVSISAAKHQTLILDENATVVLESGGEVDLKVPLPAGAENDGERSDKGVS